VNTEEFLASGTLEAFALGVASPEEMALCEQMLERSADVSSEYAAIAASIEAQAQTYAKPAPAGAWAALQQIIAEPETADNIDAEPTQLERRGAANSNNIIDKPMAATYVAPDAGQPTVPQVSTITWAIAAMLLLSVGVNVYFYQRSQNLALQLVTAQQASASIATTVSFKEEQLAKAGAKNTHLTGLLSQALLPEKGIINMKPLAAIVAKGHMAVSYDKKTRMVALRGSDMPPLPDGMVVQLWAIVDGKSVSLGLCTQAAVGNMIITEMPAGMGEPQAFALSLEKGGAHDTLEGMLLAKGEVI